MRLVVGLGNPGDEYDKTRHNTGFMLLDRVCGKDNFRLNNKFKAMEYEDNINGEKVLFIKPLSFMNLSGEVVIKYVNFYKLNPYDILVIQDDLDMELGNYKLQFNHGDGGHNGIKNIILNLGSREFLRLKIGISKVDKSETKDYVLGKFNKSEIEILENSFIKLKDIVNDYVKIDQDLLMGKYNSKSNN